jgi:predicted transposase YdaD
MALPLFELEESEKEITEEICTYIRDKKHCMPDDILDEIVVAMYLNIIEYIDDAKQDELMEMIDMVETYNGLISQIRNEGRNEGRNDGIIEGKREVINDLLKSLPIDVVAVLLSKKKSEIEEILKK